MAQSAAEKRDNAQRAELFMTGKKGQSMSKSERTRIAGVIRRGYIEDTPEQAAAFKKKMNAPPKKPTPNKTTSNFRKRASRKGK